MNEIKKVTMFKVGEHIYPTKERAIRQTLGWQLLEVRDHISATFKKFEFSGEQNQIKQEFVTALDELELQSEIIREAIKVIEKITTDDEKLKTEGLKQ